MTGSSLHVDGVGVRFGEVQALDDVTVTVARGDILGLIGPNGSGKSTLVNVVSGFQQPASGRVLLAGQDVTSKAPARRARLGLARTFQAVRLFNALSVEENVEVAALTVVRTRAAARRRAAAVLELMGLAECAALGADTLPYGLERRVAIARALALQPSFLLLDEPAAGLDEQETDELSALLRDIRDDHGCGLLVIEHDMRLITGLCDRAQVLSAGRTIAQGIPREVIADPTVIEAYLGTREVQLHA